MKRVLLFAAVLAAGAAFSADTNKTWTAKIDVTKKAETVKVTAVSLLAHPVNGNVTVQVSWVWLDSKGAAVRNGVTRYTEKQIDEKLVSKGSSLEALRALFTSVAAGDAAAQ